eukprot:1320442-Prymnesium_polylepis.1
MQTPGGADHQGATARAAAESRMATSLQVRHSVHLSISRVTRSDDHPGAAERHAEGAAGRLAM